VERKGQRKGRAKGRMREAVKGRAREQWHMSSKRLFREIRRSNCDEERKPGGEGNKEAES